MADLDSHYEPYSSEDKEDDILAKELKKKIARQEPDGQFISIQIGDDPQKAIKIRSDLSVEVKTALVACLRNYADLFTWNAADISGISPEMACHRLSVHPNAKWITT